jgi:2,4-dienoyl-CoA reductase-like NADH-dependent reductase (Old Yellow Enzyme family)
MTRLFEPFNFCGIQLRNRFVRSATMENLATSEHAPSAELLSLYESMARAQVGLIITSAVRPDREWDPHAGSRNLMIDRDDLIPGLRQLTQRVHSQGGKIAIQLGAPFRFRGALATPSKRVGQDNRRELTVEDIKEIAAQYGLAAERSLEAGFDGVQLNAAHGFLSAQFLSPAYNHRTDRYGGCTENRARFVSESATRINFLCCGRPKH